MYTEKKDITKANPSPVTVLKRDANNLFVEPKDEDIETLIQESHNRDRFAAKVNYADQWTGNPNSLDKAGNYNCKSCNQYRDPGDKCLWVDIKKVDGKAGSCRNWEMINAGDPEIVANRESVDVASYGVAENGEGFGCHRCPYSSRSVRGPDSQGRALWCGYGAFRVQPNACCALNGATLKDSKNDLKEGRIFSTKDGKTFNLIKDKI